MYTIQALFEGEALSQGVISPVVITNGRNDLDTAMTQFFCQVTVFREALQNLFTTAGKDIRFYGAGSTLDVQMKKTGGASFVTVFEGVITDTQSDKDTITFTAIDKDINTLSRTIASYTGWSGPNYLDNYLWLLASNAGVTGWFESAIQPPLDSYLMEGPTTSAADKTKTASAMANLSQDGYRSLTRINVPSKKATLGVGRNILQGSGASILSLTDSLIDANYDLRRDASTVANDVLITKATTLAVGTDSTAEDLTSQALIGVMGYEADSYLETQADRDKRADQELAKRSPFGWPLYVLRTSYDRISSQFTDEIDCYEKLVPCSVVNVSAITEPYIETKAVIQQVTHFLSEKYWQMDILAANFYAVYVPQRWTDVTSSVTWANAPSEMTWDMAKTIQI
jgi:hypothetical protein